MSNKRSVCKFLGRNLGTFTGWDGDPGESFWLYNFEPAEGIPLPKCETLTINEIAGQFQVLDTDGNSVPGQTWDIITILRDIPRA